MALGKCIQQGKPYSLYLTTRKAATAAFSEVKSLQQYLQRMQYVDNCLGARIGGGKYRPNLIGGRGIGINGGGSDLV